MCRVGRPEEIYIKYHDCEWGVPVYGRKAVVANAGAESFQAGLSWIMILRRRKGFFSSI